MSLMLKIIKKDSVGINNLVQNVLSFIFMNKIQDLFESNKKGAILRKQFQIKNLLSKINDFLRSNPYSYIEISFGEDFSIRTRNFNQILESREPNYYRLTIDPTWSDFKVHQLSIDKLFLMEMKYETPDTK